MTDIKNVKYEDTVQCFFFLSSYQNVNWEELCETLHKTAASFSNNYIWHRDEFKIYQPLMKIDDDLPPHLASSTCFGDNVEDEWFIAYLVLKLTEVHNDLIVQIEDNDGDFLLIEAADFLPPWANPETTANRVFIYNNHIHLIPTTVAELETPLKLDNAIQFIKAHTEETKVSRQIELAILERIGAYPNRIRELSHKTTVTLPVDLAALLILKPTLISPLVNAYCNHDDIDAKNCQKLKLDDLVDISLQFTKFQYAMTLHSKVINNCKYRNIYTSNKRSEIGFKLACGFEMIMSEAKKDKFSSMEYKKFLANLTKNNYFKGNIEGSKDYNQLLEKSKIYFMEMECPVNSYVYENILQIMSSNEYIKLKDTLIQNHHLYIHDDDSDNWLNVDPDKLDDLLNKNYRKQVKSEDLITSSVVTSGLSNFLSQRSDFEGIEENESTYIEDDNIKFDSDLFFKTVESMLNMVTLNVSDEDTSDFSDDEIQDVLTTTDEQLGQELAEKMCSDQNENLNDEASILSNFVKSIKEEELSGPTSNILRSIGINRTELLDSDDDID